MADNSQHARYADLARQIIDGTSTTNTTEEVIDVIGKVLSASALHVERLFVSIEALHPGVRARTYLWDLKNLPVETTQWMHGLENRPGYFASPDHQVHQSGAELRVHLTQDWPRECDLYGQLAAQGLIDYFIAPMRFSNGCINTLSIATRRPNGFQEQDLDAFRQLPSLFAIVFERHTALETLQSVVDTYLEHDAGQKVLSGKMRAGDGTLVMASILIADLRGFTRLTSMLSPSETVSLLNSYFECLVGPIQNHGGHVLKFMGDAVLAFFPDTRSMPSASPLSAIAEVRERLAKLNCERAAAKVEALSHAICLHYGEVIYGNIGSKERLDFTIIGDAVNVAARGCDAAKELSVEYIFTDAFAVRYGRERLVWLGDYELRDVSKPVALFTHDTRGDVVR